MTVLAGIPGPRMRVLGLQATYEKHGLDVQEDALRAGQRPDDPDWGREPPDRWGGLATGEDVQPIETEPGAWPEFYRRVAHSLRTGDPPPVPPGEAVVVLEVIEAALESASGRTVHG